VTINDNLKREGLVIVSNTTYVIKILFCMLLVLCRSTLNRATSNRILMVPLQLIPITIKSSIEC